MNQKLLEKLLEYIDAKVRMESESAKNSSDGGLIESIQYNQIKDELFVLNNTIKK